MLLTLLTPAFAETLSLPEIERVALSGSPRIRAAEAEIEMLRKRAEGSGTLEDPRLKIGINNLPAAHPSFRRSDMTSKELGVSQMLPLGGKLSAREAIARYEYLQSRQRLRKEKLQLIAAIRSAVYELAYARESISILNEMKTQVRLLIDSEIAATTSGTGSLSSVIKANLEYTMLDEELIELAEREESSRHMISYLAGSDIEASTRGILAPDFQRFSIPAARDSIIAGNPDLAMLKIEHDRDTTSISLKEKDYIPDVELGMSYMQRDSGPMGKRDDMISGMATFNIPLWFASRNILMVEEMKKKGDVTRMSYEDKKNELMFRAAALLSRMKKWEEMYRLYTEQLVPQASLALETSLARYRTGSGEFMQAIDNLRTLLRYKKDAVMACKEYLISRAELEALAGVEAPR